ncbi:MAG: CCA tRNA nucleotidyltransferase [Bacillus sp. (in: firmicutes)]
MNELFIQALPILQKLEAGGFEAVFVGGCVRDYLLKRPIHDVDIATSATPQEVKRIFKKTVDVGIQHGTVLVIENGASYEITTYRAESEYEGNRKPKEVKFIRSLQDDLERRDFTMNAIAMNARGEIIDPFEGRQAIQNELIDTVGNAGERFSEDALRMMRALRFVSQLSFTCSDRTLQALCEHRDLLHNISIERITAEFEKLLDGRNVQQALRLLLDTQLFRYMPGFAAKEAELAQASRYDVRTLDSLDEKWALLLYFVTSLDEIEMFLRAWKLPVKRIRSIQAILRAVHAGNFQNKMTLFTNGLDCSLSAVRLASLIKYKNPQSIEEQVISMWNALPIRETSQLAVDGTLLKEWSSRPQGPWIKETLHIITEKVLNLEIPNEIQAIKKEVLRCNLI